MESVISIQQLNKIYASGHAALQGIDLEIRQGEIFALLGPNGAGKTTLISIICGIVNPGAGRVRVAGFDIKADYRAARSAIGLVPQELVNDVFETVWATVRFSRGLFGKKPDPQYLEQLLKDLSLWDKRDAKIFELSGGMKRRVMIAKALSHEPSILFLDEPTAGVDVELRRDMWNMVRRLRERGVTIILTTHYIEEADSFARRVVLVSGGQLVADGPINEVRASVSGSIVRATLTDPSGLAEGLHTFPGINDVTVRGQQLIVHTSQPDDLARYLLAHTDAHGLLISTTTLEDAFVRLTGSNDSRDDADDWEAAA